MAEQLLTGSIQAPGFFGLNLQDSSVQLSSGFALEATNCVIDQYGRIGSRKGWTEVNSTSLESGAKVRTIFEFVKADGNLTFAALNNKIYGTHPTTGAYVQYPIGGSHFFTGTYSQSGTTVTVTTVENHNLAVSDTVYFSASTGTAGEGLFVVTAIPSAKIFTFTRTTSATTSGNCTGINILTTYEITDDNWQVVNMPFGTGLNASAHSIWVQEGHIPLVLHKLGTPAHSHVDGYGFQRLGDVSTLPTGYTTNTFKPSTALYAFGRLWVAGTTSSDMQTVYFSDLQNPSVWTTGTAGSLDISAVIPTGDPIVSIAQHNGFLIIFCKKHIVVYAGAKDPATITLSDTITGVGCIARDSVVSVAGTDILFLSATGVQSLQRIVQEKSLPFRDISKNVRDSLISNVNTELPYNIKATYFPTDAFYLLSLPSTNTTYCFDTRGVLESGASRATIWSDISPTAFCVTETRDLYLGQEGYIGKYEDYTDNETPYRLSYYTNYFDMDQPDTIKILKKVGVIVIGGNDQDITVKWGFDYQRNYSSSSISLGSTIVYEYGIAEYGIAEYSNGISLDAAKFNASGNGKTIQLGFESDIKGQPLSIQKVDVAVKTGKNI
jgi:hypothetical protein